MTNSSTKKPWMKRPWKARRPEALAKFAEVARNNDGKPVRNGAEATAETVTDPD